MTYGVYQQGWYIRIGHVAIVGGVFLAAQGVRFSFLFVEASRFLHDWDTTLEQCYLPERFTGCVQGFRAVAKVGSIVNWIWCYE